MSGPPATRGINVGGTLRFTALFGEPGADQPLILRGKLGDAVLDLEPFLTTTKKKTLGRHAQLFGQFLDLDALFRHGFPCSKSSFVPADTVARRHMSRRDVAAAVIARQHLESPSTRCQDDGKLWSRMNAGVFGLQPYDAGFVGGDLVFSFATGGLS